MRSIEFRYMYMEHLFDRNPSSPSLLQQLYRYRMQCITDILHRGHTTQTPTHISCSVYTIFSFHVFTKMETEEGSRIRLSPHTPRLITAAPTASPTNEQTHTEPSLSNDLSQTTSFAPPHSPKSMDPFITPALVVSGVKLVWHLIKS